MKKIIKRILFSNPDFTMASLTYIAANITDYLFTVAGIRTTAYGEGNPIIQVYMRYFGVEGGLLCYKLLLCTAIIFGMKALDLIYKERGLKVSISAEHILYGGAILTTSGGALWMFSW